MSDRDALDGLGRFVMKHLRDRAFDATERLLAALGKAPSLQPLQAGLMALSAEERDLVRRSCRRIVDGAIHDFLFALSEEAGQAKSRIAITVDGKSAASLSDGLHGEPYGRAGWQARFSRFGEHPEIP